MKQQNKRKMRQIIAIVLICAICVGLIPASLPETVHAAAVSAAEQKKWYEITAKISSSWGGHIAGEITITNNSEETVQDWQIEFPWDARITGMWCGNYEQTENGYIITPADYNKNLAAGAGVTIGFLAEGDDAVLEELMTENFFQNTGVHITNAEERENMPPEPSREPVPTIVATDIPVTEPTASLTPEATVSPTFVPTVELTLAPTASPTPEATVSPTFVPTAAPTLKPTASPTLVPTPAPTVVPTASPVIALQPTETPVEDLYIYTDTVLAENTACRNLFLIDGSLEITNCMLSVQGDYVQSGGTCTVRQGTADIAGNVFMTEGDLFAYEQSEFQAGGNIDFAGDTIEFKDSRLLTEGDYISNLNSWDHDFYHSEIQIKGDLYSNERGGFYFSDSVVSVDGDMILNKGECMLEYGSRMTIKGDARLESSGRIGMYASDPSEMQIYGDLLLDAQGLTWLEAGELILGGDLLQLENASAGAFLVQDDFCITFRGDHPQKIQLTDPAATNLGTVDFRNGIEIEVPDALKAYQIIGFDKIAEKETLYLNLYAENLEQDETISCKNLIWHGVHSLTLENRHLTVQGNLELQETGVFGENGSISVSGDFSSDEACQFYNFDLDIGGDWHCSMFSRNSKSYFRNVRIQTGENFTLDEGKIYFDEKTEVVVEGDTLLLGSGCIDADGKTYKPEIRISGDLTIDSTAKTTLQNGNLFLKGDLTQTADSGKDSLEVSDDFTLCFIGNARQKVDLAYPASTTLGNMDFSNSAGIDIADEIHGANLIGFEKIGKKEKLDLYLSHADIEQDETILCENLIWHEGILAPRDWTEDSGPHNLTVQGNLTFQETDVTLRTLDCVIKGDLTCINVKSLMQRGGSMQIDGNLHCNAIYSYYILYGSLQLAGDLLVDKGGFQVISNSKANIAGDVLVTEKGSAELKIINERDYCPILQIEGDLTIDSSEKSTFSTGSLILGGDLIQTEDSAEDSFHISRSVNMKLIGKEEQMISIQDEIGFGSEFDFRESAGVYFDQYGLQGHALYGLEKIINTENLDLDFSYIYLTGDCVTTGDCTVHGALDMGQHSLTIDGDLCQKGIIKNPGKLTVTGNYIVKDRTLSIEKRTVHVGGDLRILGQGVLSMEDDEGLLKVDGDLIFSSSEQSELSLGTIRLKGNLIQKSDSNEDNLKISLAKFIFCGNERQSVNLERSILFYSLDMTESAGVLFTSGIVYSTYICGFENISNSYLQVHDLLLLPEAEQNEVFHGALTLVDSSADLQGNIFQVDNTLRLVDSYINLGSGTLMVKKNMYMLQKSGLIMQQEKDTVYVFGNFYAYSLLPHDDFLKNGRLKLYGDFAQAGNPHSFETSGNFVLDFAGDRPQAVYWENKPESAVANICVSGKGGWHSADDPWTKFVSFNECVMEGIKDELHEIIENATPGTVLFIVAATLLADACGVGELFMAVMAIVMISKELTHLAGVLEDDQNMYVQARKYGRDVINILLFVSTLVQVGPQAMSEAEQAAKALSKFKDYDYISRVLKSNWKTLTESLEGGYLDLDYFKNCKAKRLNAETITELLEITDDILNEEAAAYMAEEYKSAADLGKARNILTQAEDAAIAKGDVLNLHDIKYLIKSIGNGVSQKKMNQVIRFFKEETIPATVNKEAFVYLKGLYEGENSNIHLEKILTTVDAASEAKGGAVVLDEVEYIVRASRKRISQKKIVEVVKNGVPASVESMIEAIPKEYKKVGKCDDFAEILQAELDKSGMEYEIYKVETKEKVSIYSIKHDEVIGSNRYHYGIKVGDVIYDNLFSEGISFQAWQHDLSLDLGLEDIRLRKVKKIDRKPPKW